MIAALNHAPSHDARGWAGTHALWKWDSRGKSGTTGSDKRIARSVRPAGMAFRGPGLQQRRADGDDAREAKMKKAP